MRAKRSCSKSGYTAQPLDIMDTDSCKELFYKYYKGEKDDKNAENIITLAGHHTLTVELLAKTAYSAAITIEELYKILKAKGFDISQIVKEAVKTNVENL